MRNKKSRLPWLRVFLSVSSCHSDTHMQTWKLTCALLSCAHTCAHGFSLSLHPSLHLFGVLFSAVFFIHPLSLLHCLTLSFTATHSAVCLSLFCSLLSVKSFQGPSVLTEAVMSDAPRWRGADLVYCRPQDKAIHSRHMPSHAQSKKWTVCVCIHQR